jgi:hypothetical protein
MDNKSRRLAGILLIVFPTVIYGGISLLDFLMNDPRYTENELRQDLFRAGHAHAGVLLILALVTLRYIDDANLSERWKGIVRHCVPLSAILLPVAFFFSVLKPDATEPNSIIYLAYAGAIILAFSLLILGIGLVKKK